MVVFATFCIVGKMIYVRTQKINKIRLRIQDLFYNGYKTN